MTAKMQKQLFASCSTWRLDHFAQVRCVSIYRLACSRRTPCTQRTTRVDCTLRTQVQTEQLAGKRTGRTPEKIAFFDVDGTLIDSNIVMPYILLKLKELTPLEQVLWVPGFALQCIGFILLDIADRSTFNNIFYALYAGRTAGPSKAQQAQHVFKNYMVKKVLPGARSHVQQLKALGWHVVLVTGSLNYLMEPVAKYFEADHVIAAALEEEDGVFTGKLQGVPVVAAEKVRRMQEYAGALGVPLESCAAYSDSYSDMPMLSVVGEAFVVNPDPRLAQAARVKQWPLLDWRGTGDLV